MSARRVRVRIAQTSDGGDALAAIRRKLGGPEDTSPDPIVGEIVRVDGRASDPAVVLFADGDDAHLWIGEGLVRKVRRDAVITHEGEASPTTARVAADIRAFASLHGGDRVQFLSSDGVLQHGTIREKCRYGAIVVRKDGTFVAVGFRRIWRETLLPD